MEYGIYATEEANIIYSWASKTGHIWIQILAQFLNFNLQ